MYVSLHESNYQFLVCTGTVKRKVLYCVLTLAINQRNILSWRN